MVVVLLIIQCKISNILDSISKTYMCFGTAILVKTLNSANTVETLAFSLDHFPSSEKIIATKVVFHAVLNAFLKYPFEFRILPNSLCGLFNAPWKQHPTERIIFQLVCCGQHAVCRILLEGCGALYPIFMLGTIPDTVKPCLAYMCCHEHSRAHCLSTDVSISLHLDTSK